MLPLMNLSQFSSVQSLSRVQLLRIALILQVLVWVVQ